MTLDAVELRIEMIISRVLNEERGWPKVGEEERCGTSPRGELQGWSSPHQQQQQHQQHPPRQTLTHPSPCTVGNNLRFGSDPRRLQSLVLRLRVGFV